MWRNDMKFKYMFIYPLQNLARKSGLFLRYDSDDTINVVSVEPEEYG